MKILELVFLLMCAFFEADALDVPVQPREQATYAVGDLRRCSAQGGADLFRLEAIPGGGWDNLRNKDAGMVMKLNYSKCLITDDGRFLVPDGVYTIPVKSSVVNTYAEVFTHWNNYSSTLSRSVNAHAGLSFSHVGISGKYSREYEKVKTRQFFDKSATTRVQVRYVRYTAKTEPGFPLNDAFCKSLKKIAAHIELNRTDLATYESQMVVRDFGTHVITSVDIGAALVQVDHVKETVFKSSKHETNSMLKAASGSFFKAFGIGGGHGKTVTKSEMDEYMGNVTDSEISTYGGPIFWPRNMTVLDWSKTLDNDMVALDRSGDPIYYSVSSNTLPELPESTVYQVREYIRNAVELYYDHNTYPGCTKRDAPNFSFMANEDDGTCETPTAKYTFGGVYQTCTSSGDASLCKDLQQTNPLTGSYSCPPEYETVLLQDTKKRFTLKRRKCHRCKVFHRCCKDKSYEEYASYQAYWCSPKNKDNQNKGFIFGGLYTSTSFNPTTQSMSCPSKFYPLKLLTDLFICVSDDYEQGLKNSLPFAGLFSCKSGNPLALQVFTYLELSSNQHSLLKYMKDDGDLWPHECPLGFSQHLATVDNGCQVNYCITSGALTPQALPKLKRPPFMKITEGTFLLEDEDFSFSDDGTTWTTMELISDTAIQIDNQGNSQRNTMNEKTDSLSTGVTVAISVVGTLLTVLIVIILTVIYRRRRRDYNSVLGLYGSSGYGSARRDSEDTNLLNHIENN